MSEGDLRKVMLRSALARSLDLQHHEDKYKQGVPDLSFSGGWIELKYLPRWPPKGGPVKLRKYTTEQRQWARRRVTAGQPCWMLLQVDDLSRRAEFLLFGDGHWVWMGSLDRAGLYRKAELISYDNIDFVKLETLLRAGY